MAAYAALVSLSQTLDTILHSDGLPTSLNRHQLESLHEKVSLLKQFLENLSGKTINKEASDILESKIRDAAFEAEDLIDTHISNEDLSRVIGEIGFIVNEVNRIKAAEDLRPTNDLSHARSSGRGYPVVTGKNVVVGLDNDLGEIRDRLTGGSDALEVVPIVGMGGIGKTTLARQVFDDNYIGHHFDARAWFTISQEYSLLQVLIGLLDSMKMFREDKNKMKEAELNDSLHKCLKDRRYLVVLDDVWDTNIWDKVRMSFPEDGNGSRVLLTTRLNEVAASSRSPPHQMRFLNKEDSWNLLCNKAFGDKECPRELQQIGDEIARICEGLPLAIAVIGGLLSKGSSTQEYWRSVADNLNSVVTKDDEQCMKILFLSYNHLPHRLRPCFLYMGAFPEDCEIPVSKLIRLWVAEGFLERQEPKSVEELAEEYLIDLVERNLVMVCKKSSIGKIESCNVHDLLRYICMQKAQKEKFLYVVKYDDDVFHDGISTVRRLSIHPEVQGFQSAIRYRSKIHNSRTHSLLCTGAYVAHRDSQFYLDHKLLRVLDLIIVQFRNFPNKIVMLVHLRYLALTCREMLPPSVSQLRSLETLVYHYIGPRDPWPSLPEEIWTMPKLRHLCLFPDFFAQSLANASFLLENLQTLSAVRNVKFSKDILERVPNLKTLKVGYCLNRPSVWYAYDPEALVYLHQLETLEICVWTIYHVPHVPKLAFPRSLRRLTLNGCLIPWSYMKVIGALPNLEVLELLSFSVEGSEWELDEGEFPQLKYLLLDGLSLVKWSADERHFPCLEYLIIWWCRRLEEIPLVIGEITTLEMIEVGCCSRSAEISAKLIEKNRDEWGNEKPKVHVESKGTFERIHGFRPPWQSGRRRIL